MKTLAKNTLTYSGLVTVSQYVGRKKIKLAQNHNDGGTALFNFLVDCLVGDWARAKTTRPVKVRLLQKLDDTSYTPQSGFIYLRANAEKITINGIPTARFSFIIPKDHVEGANFYNLYLGLYTDEITEEADLSEYVAICDLTKLLTVNTINAALVVDWDLVISNNTANAAE